MSRDRPISGPFINLPSRELRDYYRVIKHPVCLKSAQKVVRGIKGREKPTGVTFLKSWQAFEDEVSYIWKNARAYNEDGSEIYQWASQLEVGGFPKRIFGKSKTSIRHTLNDVWQRRNVR